MHSARRILIRALDTRLPQELTKDVTLLSHHYLIELPLYWHLVYRNVVLFF